MFGGGVLLLVPAHGSDRVSVTSASPTTIDATPWRCTSSTRSVIEVPVWIFSLTAMYEPPPSWIVVGDPGEGSVSFWPLT